MRVVSLSPPDRRRLVKLARAAGRSPRQMLRFVLRDGFDFCEWEVRESRVSEREVRRTGTIPHDEVQRQARALIAAG